MSSNSRFPRSQVRFFHIKSTFFVYIVSLRLVYGANTPLSLFCRRNKIALKLMYKLMDIVKHKSYQQPQKLHKKFQ